MDWSLQPEVFKHYPEEFVTLSLDELPDLQRFLSHSCGLTEKKVYSGGIYSLRSNPSAGALYPCELYLQARGVFNLADGIYHFEPLSGNIRLLHPLHGGEGVEGYWDQTVSVRGLVLLVTAIYYRSSWKYGHRALRYCLLDSGHLLGAIEAAIWCREDSASETQADGDPQVSGNSDTIPSGEGIAHCSGYDLEIITRFNRRQLQEDFGFKNRELPIAMVRYGKETTAGVLCPDMQLPFINGSGFFIRDSVIELAFQETGDFFGKQSRNTTPYLADPDKLALAILQRRSIRAFTGTPIGKKDYQSVLQAAMAGVGIDCNVPLQLFVVVNRVEGMEPGLYINDRCLRLGNLAATAGYLCLEQALGADSAVTVFLVGSPHNYLPLMLKAGLVGQRIYLAATLLGLGCSGIGAFYDQEVADFLETDDLILYALAFGR